MKKLGLLTFSVLLISVIFLVGCQEQNHTSSQRDAIVIQGKTMGTTYNIKVLPETSTLTANQLQEEVDEVLRAVNQSMSTYITNSEINVFNALPAHKEMEISEDFRRVIVESIRIGRSTQTLDVTMGPLIDLWGFGPDKRPTKRPSQAQLDEMISLIGVEKLSINGHHLAKKVEGLELSFSATAKGYGIDRVAEVIEGHGLTNYLVEIGGELRISGTKELEQPWRVAIEQPDAPVGTRQVHLTISPGNNAMATSGDYRIFYEMDGEIFTHLIDPANGQPVKHDLVSVTVLHPSAMTADGLATALTVMGTDKAKAYAEENNLPVYLISKSPSGLVTYASTAFKPYL